MRKTISRSIGDIYHRRSRIDNGFNHAGKVFIIRTTGIFGVELHIFHIATGIFYRRHGTLDDFLAVGVELIFNMEVTRANPRMNTLALGISKCLGGNINILFYGTRQGTNGGPSHRLGNFYHTVEITRT